VAHEDVEKIVCRELVRSFRSRWSALEGEIGCSF